MDLWCVQNGQVIMTIPTLGRCHIFWCTKRPNTLFLRNLKRLLFHIIIYISGRTIERFCIALCDLAIHQVFRKYCIESSFYVVVKSCDHVELFI